MYPNKTAQHKGKRPSKNPKLTKRQDKSQQQGLVRGLDSSSMTAASERIHVQGENSKILHAVKTSLEKTKTECTQARTKFSQEEDGWVNMEVK